MNIRNLLLEFGSEEIPAAYIQPALEQIGQITEKWFEEQQIVKGNSVVLGTPRRLTIFVSAVHEKQEETEKLFLGPPIRIAYDAQDNLTKAGLGFAKTQNVELTQLMTEKTEKGEYLAVRKNIGGGNTSALLPDLLNKLLDKISFPKSMYWEETQSRYARPLRWILFLFGEETIPGFTADVQTSDYSYGHLIYSPNKILFSSAVLDEYKKKLRDAKVIVDPMERKELIYQQLKDHGATTIDEELLETVTYLVEYPTVIKGNINPEFLTLPADVPITCMKHHQKYFALRDAQNNLQPYFLAVQNSDTSAHSNIQKGNERVLSARLSDARFFWLEDTKTSLQDKNKKLSGLLFQAKLGNYDRKVMRITSLTGNLCDLLAINNDIKKDCIETATLCKADLATEMVKEFPELQGIMGKHYALRDGSNSRVAQGIEEHYFPKGSNTVLPNDITGAIVGMADKFDSIVGCFGAGLIPSGSEDPFALRRAGNGIIRIIHAYPDWSLSINKILEFASSLYSDTIPTGWETILPQIKSFIVQRLRAYMIDINLRYDTVDAILFAYSDDLNDIIKRAEALQEIRSLEDFKPLTIAFKRVVNILKQAREKFTQNEFGIPNESLYQEDAEKKLDLAIKTLQDSVLKNIRDKDYLSALQTIAKLRPEVDFFFDKVMVMVDEKEIRNNRLALMEKLEVIFAKLADFTQLVVEE